MDLFALPPVAALLDGAYALVEGIASLLAPAPAPTALAIVALTLIVRTALIPVGISQVRAEGARRRIAPKLQALQRKYRKNPELLQRKTMALYKAENVSPFAGFLPALLQAPVVSLVYALFIRTDINGHSNGLLTQQLAGVDLGSHLWGAGWPGILVFAALFVVMGLVAWMTRRTNNRLNPAQPDAAPLALRLQRILGWMPFATLIVAAFVPLAAAIYLATTTLWTLGERAVLRRRLWGPTGEPSAVVA